MKDLRSLTLFTFLLLFFYQGCAKKNNTIRIIGDNPNLPDGTMYLMEVYSLEKFDSVKTHHGKYEIKHTMPKGDPKYLKLMHIDNKKNYRFISFPSYVKFRGSGSDNNIIISSDSLIVFNGNLQDFAPFPKNPETFFSSIPKIKAGKQTYAVLNTELDFFDVVNEQRIKEKIKKYPYSFYLLSELNRNKNKYTVSQLSSFLTLFDDEMKDTNTYKELTDFNDIRSKKTKDKALPELENNQGKKTAIIDANYKKHLIVFWASWCLPCRTEIPVLKKVYAANNKNTEFISISIDQDKASWQKAITQEKMPWKQFIVNEKDPAFNSLQALLSLNSSVPYTVLIDNNLKILKVYTGFSPELEKELTQLLNK